MTGEDHYRTAEEMLHSAGADTPYETTRARAEHDWQREGRDRLLAAAQVHATLAAAYFAAGGSKQERLTEVAPHG